MGHGIAQIAAVAGYETALHDVAPERIEAGLRAIEGSLDKLVGKGKLSPETRAQALGRLRSSPTLGAAVADADLVIEAAPEILQLKREIFAAVSDAAPRTAVLGTNTSALSVTEIASVVASPERVVGLHFFNPPQLMELLEIVRAVQTSDATIAVARELGRRLGKTTILVKDSAGFATSRLGVLIGAEAMRMLESGVATAEDIDTGMKLAYRHPMGPLELTDLVGLDVRLAVLEHLHRELGEQFRPPVVLRQLVRAGKLGRKTGEGFYKWPREDRNA